MDDFDRALKKMRKARKKKRGSNTKQTIIWTLFLISFFALYIYNY